MGRVYKDVPRQLYPAASRNLLAHLLGSNEALQQLRREIRSLERYLDSKGQETLKEIEWRVAAKDNLDQQYAVQLFLRSWSMHLMADRCD